MAARFHALLPLLLHRTPLSGSISVLLQELEALTASGCVTAQGVLANMLLNAVYATKNEARGKALAVEAASRGDVVSLSMCIERGWMRADGDLLERLMAATGEGHAIAANRVGRVFFDGMGVPQDRAKALVWFTKAHELGWAGGQYNLGLMYELGYSVRADAVIAFMWYGRSAAQGYGLAKDRARELGMRVANGRV